MYVPEAPREEPPAVEPLVDALVDGKLARYLLDPDTASRLIREIAEETGLPRAAVRIAFKLLAPLPVTYSLSAGWYPVSDQTYQTKESTPVTSPLSSKPRRPRTVSNSLWCNTSTTAAASKVPAFSTACAQT
jgi:8-oxo-dGTP pyrophosphatase MutT (NUDIX family)